MTLISRASYYPGTVQLLHMMKACKGLQLPIALQAKRTLTLWLAPNRRVQLLQSQGWKTSSSKNISIKALTVLVGIHFYFIQSSPLGKCNFYCLWITVIYCMFPEIYYQKVNRTEVRKVLPLGFFLVGWFFVCVHISIYGPILLS